MNLWGSRFSKNQNNFFKSFNNSLKIDYILIKQDIKGSIAWSKILLKSNIITLSDQKKLETALNFIFKEIKDNPKKILLSDSEDIHSWVEKKLIYMLGDVGKKIHTGRSRNDQVTTDLRLWCKDFIYLIKKNIINFQNSLIFIAEKNISSIFPGYTHLQRAQPILFSHWCLAYFEMLKRDFERLKDCLKRIDVSPLGCGALAGTGWKINRKYLASLMGFSKTSNNSLDSVSDRDYVIELLSIASISMMHLSRFSEDLIFFNSGECNFIELSDSVTSGSSLMPQKKNPDSLELIRGKTGYVYGCLLNILVLLKGLPLAYNKDMQEDKESLFRSLNVWKNCLKMSKIVILGLKINNKICKKVSKKGYSNATDLADYLVFKGVSFRKSHKITGKIVLYSIKKKKRLSQLSLSSFKKFCKLIENDVYKYINLKNSLKRKNSQGGTSKIKVLKEIFKSKMYIKNEIKKI
ncbi:MAG: argininosuccinate lyase [Buchnera aphidicola (Periphyllus lyropictus)]|uniref:argininosuccinate lyase n=1 Tax=Buchnera aphidicola TaxID=9 RepID=UPI001EC14C4D|nr:argininosuccinate lyase [Buchnera aphidicola]NIH16766.1 argininosuccinate lyase [Buchnera aphidicola (Periphyllus lyropictus)]USS94666.1 argininosuccinate lyase [Buchnera aphidicola (Periphyllus lyropictus)]